MPITGYDIYPAFPLQSGSIECAYLSLAKYCCTHRVIIIDGYVGIPWDEIKKLLGDAIEGAEVKVNWIDFSHCLKPQHEIEAMTKPFLGGDDPLFGSRTSLQLKDFFDTGKIQQIQLAGITPLNIIYGCGSFLCGLNGQKIYIDLPKNEIQFRSRAGRISNLGCDKPFDSKQMYKRFYFVDWVVLNRHKQQYINEIDVFADALYTRDIRWAEGDAIRKSLSVMSQNYFRVLPWFEPGVWGGSWIKEHIHGLRQDVPNYAWSFELIVPENGLVFTKDGHLLQLSFDWLMFHAAENVLGKDYQAFGTDFPIRFDFLDTFDGGNLSIQCHPRPEYMKENFGEDFTQEESYYILDTKENAQVYLGFQEDINPKDFEKALKDSYSEVRPLEIEKYVQKHTAAKHDLFLIPYGTVHGSGKNNLVLEISTTPYIFTFKMYDWLRPDLDGKPRPLNIDRGMDNLYFDRKGDKVKKELISHPYVSEKGEDWECWQLPTHETHSYAVKRYHFSTSVTVMTKDSCHVLSLVEGSSIEIITANGLVQQFNYAETFVIPAAAHSYTIKNLTKQPSMLVVAYLK